MKRLGLNALCLLVSFAVVGCAKTNVQTYSAVDVSDKTITVPAGSKGLKGGLKSALSQNGWKLMVDGGPSITEGQIGASTKLKNYDTFNSRYRLLVASKRFDVCFNFSPAVRYEISFIDNQTGAEVFTLDGRDCESDIVEEFKKLIKAY